MSERRKHRIRIVYKSGAEVEVECDAFRIKRSPIDGGITEVSWTRAQPNPVHIGVDEIAAVWQLR